MTTWEQILGGSADDPVRGNPEDFGYAQGRWQQARTSAESIKTEFAAVKHGSSALNCSGLAIDQLDVVIQKFDGPIDDLARVCGELERLMNDHRERLEDLRAEAARALARAAAHWNDARGLRNEADASTARQRALQTQYDHLMLDPSPTAEASRQSLHAKIAQEQNTYRSAATKLNHAVDGLEDARKDWQRLRDAEDQRNHDTIHTLDHVHLGALHDPGWLDWIGKQLEPFVDLVNAVARGDWDQVLWALHDVLDKISGILAIVGMVLLVAALFVPGLNVVAVLGLAVMVAEAKLVVDAIKLDVDVALYERGTTNKRTGETMTSGKLLGDLVTIVLDVGGVRGAQNALGQGAKSGFARQYRSVSRSGFFDNRFSQDAKYWVLLTARGRGLTIGGQAVRNAVVKEVRNEVIDVSLDRGGDFAKRKQRIDEQSTYLQSMRRTLAPVRPTFAPFPTY